MRMNKLSVKERALILNMLVEGNSLRATARMAGVSRNTVDKLLREVGAACSEYQDKTLRNLSCTLVECDEIWSFVGMKEKNVPKDQKGNNFGDVWTWVSICADTKLVPCWHVGSRDADAAMSFMTDLADRLNNRIQLSTDGHKPYLKAVENAFDNNVDYAQLVKIYDLPKWKMEAKGYTTAEAKYSPAKCMEVKKKAISGEPDMDLCSTSYIERQNLTMRMGMRRFTRLTNAFSKKVENHMHAISLHYMHYNFCRKHQTLGTSPAVAAGIMDEVKDTKWIIEIADSMAPAPKKRGPYKKRAEAE